MLSKYKIGVILSSKLDFTQWNTQKNNINKKIDEIIITSNSEDEVKKAIEELKKDYKIKYNIYPIYIKSEYAPESKKFGLVIE